MTSLLAFEDYARAVLLSAALAAPGCGGRVSDGPDPVPLPENATTPVLDGGPTEIPCPPAEDLAYDREVCLTTDLLPPEYLTLCEALKGCT